MLITYRNVFHSGTFPVPMPLLILSKPLPDVAGFLFPALLVVAFLVTVFLVCLLIVGFIFLRAALLAPDAEQAADIAANGIHSPHYHKS